MSGPTARRLLAAATVAVGLAALTARALASLMGEMEAALWTWSQDAPDYVPAGLR